MTIKLGNTSKNSTYLKDLKEAIDKDREHPRHHGVKMQAHHVLSAKGVKRSGLGKKLEKFGYDINVTKNLSFIPCTLQGASYLGVQPHRGNHIALVERKPDQDDYDDDSESVDYHEMVAEMVKKLDLPLSKECPGDGKTKSDTVKNELNSLSKRILKLIQNKPSEAPLTSIAEHFKSGNHIGCGGVDSVKQHRVHVACPSKRSHAGKQKIGQDEEGITYKSDGKYQLGTGR